MVRRDGENTRSMKHRLYKAYVASDANPLFVADLAATVRELCDELQKNGSNYFGSRQYNKQLELRLLDWCKIVH